MALRTHRETPNNNLTIGILFCLFVVVLLIGSVSLKIFDLVRRSVFNGHERFTVAVSDFGGSDTVTIISFVPKASTAYSISVPKFYKKGENTRVVNAQNVYKLMGMLQDSWVTPKKEKQITLEKPQDVRELTTGMVLHYPNLSTNLTVLDVLRLFVASQTITSASVKKETLEENLEDSEIDKISQGLFLDEVITSEKKSIEVVNGTEIPGLGNRVARSITNSGGNVVVVTSSQEEIAKSEIQYSLEESYTASKLSEVLGIPLVKMKDGGISDIVIRIGKDKAESL